MKSLLFIKIETNGLPQTKSNLNDNNITKFPNLNSIYYKIGKINIDTNKVDIIVSKYYIIKPKFKINKDAQKIHEITNKQMLKGKKIIDVLNKLKDDITTNNVKIIIGHNINFDLNITMAEIKRNNINLNLFNYEKVDTLYFNHNYEYPKLEVLFELLYKRKFVKSHNRKSLINIIIKCFEYLYQSKLE
tara:strand:+ start:8658 stop:9224 length:567 start_codon:yes stop_codon:yes gene_type:complete